MRASYYLTEHFQRDKQEQIITLCGMIIKDLQADAIAFRGLSGALVAPIVAWELGIPIIVVRKGEHSHAEGMVEGFIEASRIVILDDLITSGDTICGIIDEIMKARSLYSSNPNFDKYPFIGIVLYKDASSHKFESFNMPVYGFQLADCWGNNLTFSRSLENLTQYANISTIL